MTKEPRLVVTRTRSAAVAWVTKENKRPVTASSSDDFFMGGDSTEAAGRRCFHVTFAGVHGPYHHSFRTQPDGRAPPRECAHRAVQLAVRAPSRGPARFANRGHRYRAQQGVLRHGPDGRPGLDGPGLGCRAALPVKPVGWRRVSPVAPRGRVRTPLGHAGRQWSHVSLLLHAAGTRIVAQSAARCRPPAAICRHL